MILIASGYFLAWMLAGLAVFPLGAALAAIALRMPSLAHATPAAAGAVVVLASLLQFTSWKMKRLACCRAMRPCARRPHGGALTAVLRGMRLALHCGTCCGNWMAVLLALGVMDWHAMALVTVAIVTERVAPRHEWVVRIVGYAGVIVGGAMMLRGL